MTWKYLVFCAAVMQLLIINPVHARLSMNHWDRFNKTTVLIVRASVLETQDDGSQFNTAKLKVDKVILNESEVKNIGAVLDVKFSRNSFQPTNTGNSYLRSNSNELAYFFLGRFEGKWRFADPDAAIWVMRETQSGNESKKVLCFPPTYIKNLPTELFEKLDIPVLYHTARLCRSSRLYMNITRYKSIYYSDFYITENKLIDYFEDEHSE